jgi:hypothetical protein
MEITDWTLSPSFEGRLDAISRFCVWIGTLITLEVSGLKATDPGSSTLLLSLPSLRLTPTSPCLTTTHDIVVKAAIAIIKIVFMLLFLSL